MNMKRIAALAICWAIYALPLFSNQDDIFINASFEEVRALAGKEGKLFLVHFRASWCMPCLWMEENTFSDESVADYLRRNYVSLKVDIDDAAGRALQKRFDVNALPTILVFSAQGQLLDRLDAALEPQPFRRYLERFNQPRHRIGQGYADTGPVLATPVARLPVYRPPLIPENDPQPASQSAQPLANHPPARPALLNASYAPPSAGRPEAPQHYEASTTPSFTPRSDKVFSIQLGIYSDYQNALRAVAGYENRFKEHEVQLIAFRQDGKLVYRILIGRFGLLSKAEDYLLYLNRNDVRGIIREIGK